MGKEIEAQLSFQKIGGIFERAGVVYVYPWKTGSGKGGNKSARQTFLKLVAGFASALREPLPESVNGSGDEHGQNVRVAECRLRERRA